MNTVTGPLFAAIAVILVVGVHIVKLHTEEAMDENLRIEAAIQREQQAIQILSAEWSHLNQPAKLEQMAGRFLKLEEVKTTQIVAMEDIPYLGLDLFDQHDVSGNATLVAAPEPELPDYYLAIKNEHSEVRR